MLGKGIFFLLSIVMFGAFIPSVFANENSEIIILEVDKDEYNVGDSLTVSGMILEKKMPVIAMRVYDPDGSILSANNIEIQHDDTFSKTIFLDEPFYAQIGTYKISFDYGKEQSQMEFVILDKDFDDSEIIQVPNPQINILTSDKDEYKDADFVAIGGMVSEKLAPTVLIGIYDPFDFPVGFYFGEINSDLEFSISFLVKDGVNFKTFGTYSAIAYYEDSEEYVEFDYVKTQTIEDLEPEILEEPVQEEPVQEEPVQEEPIIEDPEPEVIEESKIIPVQILTKENHEKEIVTKTEIESNEKKIIQQTTNIEKPKPIINENNLSVEDVALGIMLNQITLSCDDDDYVDSISYYDGMGPALMRLCNFNEAINHFDLTLLDDPENVQVLTNKGSALSKLGFYDEAISFYDHALKIDPNFLPAINNKANTLVNLGYVHDAVENYNSILSIDPKFTLAKQNLDVTLKQFSNNFQYTIDEKSNDITLDSISKITNKVADSTVNTVNKINENPSNVFEQIGVVFSMIGTSFFGFLN